MPPLEAPAPPLSRSQISRSRRAAAAAQPSTVKVTVYPTAVKVEVAPGQLEQPWPCHLPIPEPVGVFEMRVQPDGSYRAVLRLHSKMVRMTANITETLGLGITYASLRRLMTAGFVRFSQPTPNQYSFCLESYFRHVQAVRNDPEFWAADGRNYKRYMEAI